MKTVYIIYLLLATLNGFCQQKNWIKDGDFNMDHHFYKEALISFDNALNSGYRFGAKTSCGIPKSFGILSFI